MKITQFKKGDLITRIKPTESFDDHSYCGDQLEFVGFEKGIIICIFDMLNKPSILKLDEAHGWNDNNWDYLP